MCKTLLAHRSSDELCLLCATTAARSSTLTTGRTDGLQVGGDVRDAGAKVGRVLVQHQRDLGRRAGQVLLHQLLVLRVDLHHTRQRWLPHKGLTAATADTQHAAHSMHRSQPALSGRA